MPNLRAARFRWGSHASSSRLHRWMLAIGIGLAMGGCTPNRAPATSSTAHQTAPVPAGDTNVAYASGESNTHPNTPVQVQPLVDTSQAVESMWQFGLDLARHSDRADNVVISPASLYAALSMVYFGVQGKTAEEIASALRLPAQDQAIGQSLQDILARNHASAELGTLSLANRLDVDKGQTLEPEFSLAITRYAQASFFTQDFVQQAAAARTTINAWVAERTRGKISELLPQDALDRETRVVLTNAFYFYAPWQSAMDPKQTQPKPFVRDDGREVTVPMMLKVGEVKTLQREHYSLYALPYADARNHLILLVPAAEQKIDAVLAGLDGKALQAALQEMSARELRLIWPRLQLGAAKGQSTTKLLQALGVKKAFTLKEADFGRMVKNPAGYVLDDVYHAARLEVDEAGTTASAASGAVVSKRSMPSTVLLNKPFAVALVDVASQMPYMLAVVRDPSKN